jgi:hypothetical protein
MNPTTLPGKVMAGYQGWFNTPADGTGMGWRHYARGTAGDLTPDTCKFDIWPDTSELDADELCETTFRHDDGTPASLPTSCNRKTVLRHFRWMAEYGLDGVFVQRFYQYCARPEQFACMLKVLDACREGARLHNRAYGMMYDMTGMPGNDSATVIEDWKRLCGETGLIEDPTYIRHNGKPVVVVWGLGFTDKPGYTWRDCVPLVRFLKEWGATVMLGVPTGWREQPQEHLYDAADPSVSIIRWFDCVADKALHEAIGAADIVSPWSVARVATIEAAQRLAREVWRADMDWCASRGLEFMPVVYPGFSWRNARHSAPLDQIPRRRGAFLQALYDEAIRLGVRMIYQAMFDEVDESTAIFKCSNRPPGGRGQFLDMEGVPSDHYLRLVGRAAETLRRACGTPENGEIV